MSKKLITLLLAVCMLFCLSACGKTDTDNKINPSQATVDNREESTDKTAESIQAPTEESTGVPTEEPTTNPSEEPTTKPVETPTTTPTPTACSHSYKDATCTTPRICTKCGVTTGSALGHSYKDATCTAAKTCTKCGSTEGIAVEHRYENGICVVCKLTDEEKYVEAKVKAADEAFSDYTKYDDALKIIKAGLQKFPQNSILKAKKDYYQGFAPCYLSNMTPYDKTVWFDSLDNDKDIFGTTHTNCIVKDNMAQWANATYDLSAKYNTFSATAYPRFGGQDVAGYIKIYVDGECIYSNTNISPTARPFQISLDVTGAMNLKIEYEWDSTFALAEAKVQRTVK